MATAPRAVEGGILMLYKLFAIGAGGFLVLMLYACLIVASDADDQTDKRLNEHIKDKDNDD